MVDHLFISGLDLHETIGMPIVMIEDIVRRGCPSYNIENSTPVTSISETFFFNEPRKIQWGPHENYESEKLLYRLSMVKLPVRDVIHHCKSAYGDIESARYVLKLTRANNETQGMDKGKPLPPTEKATALTMIAAVLCPNGDTRPLAERGLAGKIAKRASQIGRELSDDTARRWLKQVSEIIDIRRQ